MKVGGGCTPNGDFQISGGTLAAKIVAAIARNDRSPRGFVLGSLRVDPGGTPQRNGVRREALAEADGAQPQLCSNLTPGCLHTKRRILERARQHAKENYHDYGQE
jgi:hypothetical protein